MLIRKSPENLIPNYNAEIAAISKIANMGFFFVYNYRQNGGAVYCDCTFPPDWQVEYERDRLGMQDPTVRMAIVSTGNRRWSEHIIPDIHKVFKKAARHDLNFGATLSRSEGFFGVSVLSGARHDREFTDMEIEQLSHRLDIFRKEIKQALTLPRDQIRVLRMLGQGKSYTEIANAMNMSVNTAKAKAKKAAEKFGTPNATATVFEAQERGLFSGYDGDDITPFEEE